MKYLIFLLSFTIALAAQVSAQAQTSREVQAPLTLEECMIYAVENSPITNIQEAQNRIAAQNYTEAIARLLPGVSGSIGAGFNFGRSLGDDNIYADANSFNNSYGLNGGLTIFSGLRNINSIRMANVNRQTGRHQLEQKSDEVAYATMEAYFNVLYYRETVVLAEQQLEESRANLRRTERMEELGLKGAPDVAELRSKEAADSYVLTQERNRLAIGLIVLKQQMNFPLDEDLQIAPYDFDGMIAGTAESAADIFERASGSLPRALAAGSTVESSKIDLQIARGGRYPSLMVSGGYSTGFFRNLDGSEYDPFRAQFSNKRGYAVGLSLDIPIFNRLSTQSDIRRTRHRYTIARIEHDQTMNTLYRDIEQAVADMNGGAHAHTQAARQSEYSAVAYEVNRRKYEEGLISALELHTSSNMLMKARTDELNSRLGYILKKRMVDYYRGIPFIGAEQYEQ
ncbi:MAG: TolC family protein [Alistipes sp.]|jgi:outer membrane protein|nr:TolC family protein [Alistipes sp.]